jgi:hypothetical protein
MNEQDPKLEQDSQEPSYTPASPAKRVLAWMGVVYMVLLVGLNAYVLATGAPLTGIPGLLFFPACGAFAALQLLKYRALRQAGAAGTGPLALGLLGAALGLFSLVDGVRSLVIQLGG